MYKNLDLNVDTVIFEKFVIIILMLLFLILFGLIYILVAYRNRINKFMSGLSEWDIKIIYHCLLFFTLQFMLVIYLFK
ncbi:hypothetical protein AKG98_3598 [Moritella sp. JT01]|nr:hypothetical protein AKG98_3598 [Moritella sp. JT01]